MEASSDRRIVVREITDVHANYSITGEGQPGLFSVQLILDSGAEEHLVLPDAEGTKVVLRLLRGTDTAYFDTEQRVISFGPLSSVD